jgi:hypothetical protein
MTIDGYKFTFVEVRATTAETGGRVGGRGRTLLSLPPPRLVSRSSLAAEPAQASLLGSATPSLEVFERWLACFEGPSGPAAGARGAPICWRYRYLGDTGISDLKQSSVQSRASSRTILSMRYTFWCWYTRSLAYYIGWRSTHGLLFTPESFLILLF